MNLKKISVGKKLNILGRVRAGKRRAGKLQPKKIYEYFDGNDWKNNRSSDLIWYEGGFWSKTAFGKIGRSASGQFGSRKSLMLFIKSIINMDRIECMPFQLSDESSHRLGSVEFWNRALGLFQHENELLFELDLCVRVSSIDYNPVWGAVIVHWARNRVAPPGTYLMRRPDGDLGLTESRDINVSRRSSIESFLVGLGLRSRTVSNDPRLTRMRTKIKK